jgi:hypothetical protein
MYYIYFNVVGFNLKYLTNVRIKVPKHLKNYLFHNLIKQFLSNHLKFFFEFLNYYLS